MAASRLPVRQLSAELGNAAEGMPQPADIHVLLVDDERLSRTVVGSLLRKCDYKVTLVESGLEALEVLRQHKHGTFQLVLADVMMPDVDGLELLKHVRGDSAFTDIPVVMMSANERTETVLECIREGAEDYLLKPVTKKVVQCIWQHVWRRQQHAHVLKPSGPSQAEAPASGDEDELLPDVQATASDQLQEQLPAAARPAQADATAANEPLQSHADQAPHIDQEAERRQSHAQASASSQHLPAGAHSSSQQQQQNGRTPAQLRQGISLGALFQRRGSLVNSASSLRIFCEALKLVHAYHAQGKAIGGLLPSRLLVTPGGNLALAQATLPAMHLQLERSLYASPEELLNKPATTASDVYALGVLFFELFHPLTDPADRARALSGLRHRILPLQLLQQKPQEAAFVLALLHPDPSARPSVESVINCQLLTQLLTSGQATDPEAKSAPPKPAPTRAAAGADEDAMLLNFLKLMRSSKLAERERVRAQLNILNTDLQQAQVKAKTMQEGRDVNLQEAGKSSSLPNCLNGADVRRGSLSGHKRASCEFPDSSRWEASGAGAREAGDSCAPLHAEADDDDAADVLARKWHRVSEAFEPLEAMYFQRRQNGFITAPPTQPAIRPQNSHHQQEHQQQKSQQEQQQQEQAEASAVPEGPDPLGAFSEDLTRFSRKTHFQVQAALRHTDLTGAADMVCSAAFDRDDQYFATAGVGRRIKIFELADVVASDSLIHYPVAEIVSRSKLSCIVWNAYLKSSLLAADYDGRLQMWDVTTRGTIASWQQHSHRVWSADFSQVDPTSFVSGSDDGTVRLWNLRQRGSLACIDTRANVCSVQFSPTDPHLLAVGSANYRMYLYDRRRVEMPLAVVAGHKKAVSYVRFLGGASLVSASTDSRLKVWDIAAVAASQGQTKPTCTLTGHVNEKNFVGLSVTADGHIACGSEDNAVYAYHRALPLPIARQTITAPQQTLSLLDDTPQPQQTTHQQFVSSVCWAWRGGTLIAANSAGTTQVLKLVSS